MTDADVLVTRVSVETILRRVLGNHEAIPRLIGNLVVQGMIADGVDAFTPPPPEQTVLAWGPPSHPED